MMNMRKEQGGAVLIVGLVLLIVVTLLAISGLKTTGLQTKMAGNQQYRVSVFQAAESIIRQFFNEVRGVTGAAVDPLNPLVTAINNADAGLPPMVRTVNPAILPDWHGPPMNATASLSYVGQTELFNNSIGSGARGTFVLHDYRMTGTANFDDVGATATHTIGITYRSPAPN